jgi:acyl-CoA thioesterase FadM
MNVVYRKPVPVDKEIVVEGWQEDEKGRNRFRVGEIRDVEGNLLARGTARFVAIDQEHFEKVRATEQKV